MIDEELTRNQWRNLILSENGPGNPLQRHLLLVIESYFGKQPLVCYASLNDLQVKSSMSRKTIIKHLGEVKDAGWLHVESKGTGQGWKRNVYWPMIPKVVEGLHSNTNNTDINTEENTILTLGEKKEISPAFNGKGISIPTSIDSSGFLDSFQNWLIYLRDVHGRKISRVQISAFLKQLEKLQTAGHDPAACLDNSIARNRWEITPPAHGKKINQVDPLILSASDPAQGAAPLPADRLRGVTLPSNLVDHPVIDVYLEHDTRLQDKNRLEIEKDLEAFSSWVADGRDAPSILKQIIKNQPQ